MHKTTQKLGKMTDKRLNEDFFRKSTLVQSISSCIFRLPYCTEGVGAAGQGHEADDIRSLFRPHTDISSITTVMLSLW